MDKITALIVVPSNDRRSGLLKVEPDSLASYCDLVSGWTRRDSGTTPCGQPVSLVSDEDALTKGEPCNEVATRLWNLLNPAEVALRSLFGIVVVTGGPRDIRTYTDVPAPVVELFRQCSE